jgi:hypothetical protein
MASMDFTVFVQAGEIAIAYVIRQDVDNVRFFHRDKIMG